MGRVLVLDDDPRIRQMLQRYLTGEGFAVELAGTIRQAQQAFARQSIDLILLDLKLGPENGLDFARDVRATNKHIPIIILSSKNDVLDKVVGLEIGADDYVSKPFHLRELLARMRSLMRRVALDGSLRVEGNTDVLRKEYVSFGKWRLARANQSVTSTHGAELALTSREFKLLDIFVKQPQRILSRDQLLDKISGRNWSPYDRSIDTQIRRLRKKIEDDPGNPKLIKTVRGEGYMLAVDVHSESCCQ